MQYSGSAILGTDVPALPTSVSLLEGEYEWSVEFTAIDDDLMEGTENVIAVLQPGAGYSVGSSSNATVRIADNDGTPISVINIDFLFATNSPVYTNDGGVFSASGGFTWNGVLPVTNYERLLDQFGNPTFVELEQFVPSYESHSPAEPPYSDGYRACIIDILNLSQNQNYDLSVYFADGTSRIYINPETISQLFAALTLPPTGQMPGRENGDYLVFTNVSTVSYPSGHTGIRLLVPAGSAANDSLLVALQIREHAPRTVVLQAPRVEEMQFKFTFAARVGQRYRVEYQGNLDVGAWVPLGDDFTALDSTVTVSDPIGGRQRFYRIVVLE